MLSLLPLCVVALLLISLASADPIVPGPVAGDDRWSKDSPAEAPVAAVTLTLQGIEDKQATNNNVVVADDVIGMPPRKKQRFRPHHNHAALSPEARRKLDHEAHCGPRVPVRPGFPWPARDLRCRGGSNSAVPAPEPEVRPVNYRRFPIWNP
ncbi:hypothetical protein PR202_ga00417 [Eleusine coracana subsp. coracana]|uniref:Uncharacterized protein n=1 Tax=Eleusine coracana subsp. coracana TaxID=191504 RepID=A0AAV5BCP4_ELECO|nr:hypothetical protein PR202_ga00417 [Eleusine coracana subsp. coracana]